MESTVEETTLNYSPKMFFNGDWYDLQDFSLTVYSTVELTTKDGYFVIPEPKRPTLLLNGSKIKSQDIPRWAWHVIQWFAGLWKAKT